MCRVKGDPQKDTRCLTKLGVLECHTCLEKATHGAKNDWIGRFQTAQDQEPITVSAATWNKVIFHASKGGRFVNWIGRVYLCVVLNLINQERFTFKNMPVTDVLKRFDFQEHRVASRIRIKVRCSSLSS